MTLDQLLYLRANAKDKVARRVASHLPKRLVMWCYFRVLAHATTGEFSSTVVPELTAMEAVKRWPVK